MELVRQGGYVMYLLIGIALAVVAMTVRSWLSVTRGERRPDAVVETRIDSVLFWGAYGVVLGILGTLIGIAQAATAIQAAGQVEAGLVWAGIRVSLITVIFGLLIFSIALVAWFVLRVRYRRTVMGTA